MAEAYDISPYASNLPPEAKELYFKKLSVSQPGGDWMRLPDPFSIKTELWQDDPSRWPDLQYGDIYNYLIYKTGNACTVFKSSCFHMLSYGQDVHVCGLFLCINNLIMCEVYKTVHRLRCMNFK